MIVYIFGYGSLLNPDDWVIKEMVGNPVYGHLQNHQRHFKVGIDNTSPLYDKKHYLFNGKRADCVIGALGVNPKSGKEVNGLAIPVDEKLFQKINIREKSYLLSENVASLFSEDLKSPLFTYYPKKENYNLYRKGKEEDNIFMPKRYLEYCLEGFRMYQGEDDFLSLTEDIDYPVRDLDFFRAPGAI